MDRPNIHRYWCFTCEQQFGAEA